MADPQTNVSSLPSSKIGLLESIVEGRVQRIEQPQESEWTYFTLQLKARDEYTAPSTIQISQPASQRPFCREGDVVRAKVVIGGYGRRYNGNLYVTNTLTFVETL